MTESILSHFNAEDDLIVEVSDYIDAKCELELEAYNGWRKYCYKGKSFSIKCYTFFDVKNDTDKERPSFLPGISISFNWITDFSSYTELVSWLEILFDTYFPLIEDSRITRLDIPLHLKVPYSRIRNTIERPRARSWREVIEKYKSLYLGKKPREINIYETEFEQDSIDYPKKKKRK